MSAARKLTPPVAQSDEALALNGPRRLGPEASARVSPARELQASLLVELSNDINSAGPRRWPGVARLAFIGGTSCALWGAILLGVYKLFDHA